MTNNPYSPQGAAPFVPQPDPGAEEKKRLRRFANLFGAAGLTYLLVNFLSSLVLSSIFSLYYSFTGSYLFGTSEITEDVLNILVYICSFAAGFGLYAALLNMPRRVWLPLRPTDPVNDLLAIPATFAVAVVGSMITAVLASIISVTGYIPVNPETAVPRSVMGYVLFFISLVILPALVEEIAFRGIVMQSLRRFGDGFALVVSAVIFGIFHLNLIQGPYALSLGLWMGYLVLRTGSLRTSILLHGCINLSAALMTILTDGASEQTLMLINAAYISFWSITGAASILGLFLRNRSAGLRLHPAKTRLNGGEKAAAYFAAPFMLALLAACMFFMLANFAKI